MDPFDWVREADACWKAGQPVGSAQSLLEGYRPAMTNHVHVKVVGADGQEQNIPTLMGIVERLFGITIEGS
jgi:hypothetical protein